MATISGTHSGHFTLTENTRVTGTILGDVLVPAPWQLELNGTINGALTVSSGGRAEVRGTVIGVLTNDGATVDIWGYVETLRDLRPQSPSTIHPKAVIGKRI